MKRVLYALAISFLITSCSLNDDNQDFNLSLLPVNYVEMPTQYAVDSVTQIPVTYINPSACYTFSNFYYNAIGNERTVAIYCAFDDNQGCTQTNYETTVPLNFKPKYTGTYTFRFWTGVDAEGIDQYIEHEIVVDH